MASNDLDIRVFYGVFFDISGMHPLLPLCSKCVAEKELERHDSVCVL